MTDTAMGDDAESWEIARRLTGARRRGEALAVYPGAQPPSMEAGYACQDAAIALWLRTWQQTYPDIDFAARLDWWRTRWRDELVPQTSACGSRRRLLPVEHGHQSFVLWNTGAGTERIASMIQRQKPGA